MGTRPPQRSHMRRTILQDPGGGDRGPLRQHDFRDPGPAGLGDGRRHFSGGQDLVSRQVIDLFGPSVNTC
jgi:hypothetical protein